MVVALTDVPLRIMGLPRDPRGYPVPKFVLWVDGKPDFRRTDTEHWMRCALSRRCWICGEALGRHVAFVCGPSTALTKATTEPGSHLECAHFALRTCPYILFPRRGRDGRGLEEEHEMPGIVMLDRNPGVWLLWVASTFEARRTAAPVIDLGPPSDVEWWAVGRRATEEEARFVVDRAVVELSALNPRFDVAALRAYAELLIVVGSPSEEIEK